MQHQEAATLENNPIEPGEAEVAPSERHPRLPLGVGSIIGGSFSIFFKHIVAVLLIGLIPVLFGQVAPALVLGMATNFDFSAPLSIGASMFAGAAMLAIVQLAAYSVTTALIVQLAYDAKLQRRVYIGRYLRPALTALPPILILSFAVGALVVGLFFLLGLFGPVSRILALAAIPVQIVLSLWILAVFSVMAPAVVIERAGYSALARSAALTRDYRWPIMGTLFLTAAIALIMLIIGVFVIGFFGTLGASLIAGILIAALSSSALSILAIAASLIYARLREIKEGVSVDQIANVFD